MQALPPCLRPASLPACLLAALFRCQPATHCTVTHSHSVVTCVSVCVNVGGWVWVGGAGCGWLWLPASFFSVLLLLAARCSGALGLNEPTLTDCQSVRLAHTHSLTHSLTHSRSLATSEFRILLPPRPTPLTHSHTQTTLEPLHSHFALSVISVVVCLSVCLATFFTHSLTHAQSVSEHSRVRLIVA